MGGLASGAIYLASSLAAGPPPAVAIDPAPIEAIAAEPQSTVERGYVIVDLPRRADDLSPGGLLMGAAIGVEVRREAEGGQLGETIVEDQDDAGALNASVLALHDQRIGVLRGRIDELREERAGAGVISELGAKLRRAEAARHLAVARVALAACAEKRVCAPVAKVAATEPPRPTQSPSSRRILASKALSIMSPRQAKLGAAKLLNYGHEFTATEAHLPIARAFPEPAVAEPGIKTKEEGLARSRRLLAKARAALGSLPHAESEAPIRLAGLWQWEGSEQWSLASAPRTTA